MARVQANPLKEAEVTRPVAAPVEFFQRGPAPESTNKALELASALKGLAPSLNRFIDGHAAEYQAEERTKAERDAMMASAAGWQEAIDKGEVEAGASPIYQKYWQEQKGKLAGDKFLTDTWAAWNDPANGLRGNNDPQAINKWLEDRRTGFVQDKPNDFLNGFLPRMRQAEQQIVQAASSDFTKRVQQETEADLSQWMMERIIIGKRNGTPDGGILSSISEGTVPARFAGMNGKDINRIQTQSIIALAEQLNEPSILDLAYKDRPDFRDPTKTVAGPGNTAAYSLQIEQARARMLSRAETEERRRELKDARERKERAGRAHADFIGKLARGEMPTAQEIAAASKDDPDIGMRVFNWDEAFQRRQRREDPQELFDSLRRIRLAAERGESQMTALGAEVGRGIKDPETVRRLHEAISKEEVSTILRDPTVSSVKSTMLRGIYDPMSPKMGANDAAIATQADIAFNEAIVDFETSFREKYKRAPNRLEIMEEVGNISSRIQDAARKFAQTGVEPTGATRPNFSTRGQPSGGSPSPETPQEQAPSQYPAAPQNPQERKLGTIYMTPQGPMKWEGRGWNRNIQ